MCNSQKSTVIVADSAAFLENRGSVSFDINFSMQTVWWQNIVKLDCALVPHHLEYRLGVHVQNASVWPEVAQEW